MLTRLFGLLFLSCSALAALGCGSGATFSGSDPSQFTIAAPAARGPMVYVSNSLDLSVTGYRAADNGDVIPEIRIQGPDTQLQGARGLAFDRFGRLYVCCGPNGVNVYAPGANGDARPIAVIGCAGDPFVGAALAIAPDGDLVLGQNFDAPGAAIQWLEEGQSGCARFATIAGPDTDINSPNGLAVDDAGLIYAADGAPDFGAAGISIYQKSASGDSPPLRFLSGPRTGLIRGQLAGVALDASGTMYALSVGNSGTGGFINAFDRNANGDALPLRTLGGSGSGLDIPQAIAVDHQGILYVANIGGGAGSITSYDSKSLSPLHPLRVVKGPHTGLHQPLYIAVLDQP
ncbi:MAG TPA: hypothetical protein VKR99_00815 [Candidatus Eremiobacteraceae bacterium]|nr:hypothetical protein [Candidatus Eremiobacteraceae bacterium]